ncbi:MAG: glycosyltransferase [Chitinophagales bacterium]
MIVLVFVFCVLLLMYAYILYPYWIAKRAKDKTFNYLSYSLNDILPDVCIVIPAHNEEKIIAEKLNSILTSTYPKEKIHILVGLDDCSDATKSIIENQFNFQNINIVEVAERQGKPMVLNQLIQQHTTTNVDLLIITDANIIFEQSTIFELVKYFKDEKIGLVDSVLMAKINHNKREEIYWKYETELKINESLVFGNILGPSGACYAIRKKLYIPIPTNFVVDDFFIGFNILQQKNRTILNSNAICFEDLITNWKQEFMRKIRISMGNFQNLFHFKKYAFQLHTSVGLMFFSHKVIRWLTPFFLLIIYYILLLEFTLPILIVTLCLPIIDCLLFIFGVEFKPLRHFHYFIVMNIAVFIGFIKFCKGVKSNVWKPTARK